MEMIMQAIRTRYIGPSDVKGSRVKADCEAGQVTADWDDALNIDANHAAARDALLRKLGWDTETHGDMVSGVYGNDYYHVFKD
jgi:hypothetical protein